MANKNTKKQIINDIVNALIQIYCFDYSNAQDKKLVDYNYKNHQTINAVIKKCTGLCLRDWDYSILRDQTYASVYESINKIAANYTEDELKLIYSDITTKKQTITNQFLTGVYKSSIFDVKSKLSGHRRDGKHGMIPAYTFCEYSEQNLDDIIEISDEEQQLDIIFFISWFNQNKAKFLTRKQLEFLEDENITKTNKCTYRKRIFENTMKAYQQEFDNCENDRINQLESQIKIIEKILEAKDFSETYLKYRNKHFIIDAITEADLEIVRAFNLGYRNYNKVIKPLRIALYKKLDELNNLLATLK